MFPLIYLSMDAGVADGNDLIKEERRKIIKKRSA